MEKVDDFVYDTGFQPKPYEIKENYKFYNNNILFRITQTYCRLATKIWVFFYRLFTGHKVSNKIKNVKGCIITSMHVFPMDSFLHVTKGYKYNTYTTSLQSNMGFGLFSKYIRICGAVPIPTKLSQLKEFEKQTINALNNNKRIIFYPEAGINPFYPGVRPFKKGAFKYAYLANKPIIPAVVTYKKTKKDKIKATITYLDPIYPNIENGKDEISNLCDKTHLIMTEYFNKHSEVIKELDI